MRMQLLFSIILIASLSASGMQLGNTQPYRKPLTEEQLANKKRKNKQRKERRQKAIEEDAAHGIPSKFSEKKRIKNQKRATRRKIAKAAVKANQQTPEQNKPPAARRNPKQNAARDNDYETFIEDLQTAAAQFISQNDLSDSLPAALSSYKVFNQIIESNGIHSFGKPGNAVTMTTPNSDGLKLLIPSYGHKVNGRPIAIFDPESSTFGEHPKYVYRAYAIADDEQKTNGIYATPLVTLEFE